MRTHSTQLYLLKVKTIVMQCVNYSYISVELQDETILFAPSVLKAETTCSYPASKLIPTPFPTLIVPKHPLLSCQKFSLLCDNLYGATIYINTNLSHQKQERGGSAESTLFTIQISDRGGIRTAVPHSPSPSCTHCHRLRILTVSKNGFLRFWLLSPRQMLLNDGTVLQ